MQMNVDLSLGRATEAAPDPRIAVAEAQLAMLEQLAEFGMSRVREVNKHTRPGELPVDAYLRLGRAIRCALILEMRIEEELAALKAGTWTPPEERRVTRSPPEPLAEEDMFIPDERIERESDRESFEHILKLPFKDAVRWICKEMGMDGDAFLRDHPLTPALTPAPAPALPPASAPAPTPAAAPASSSSEDVRDAVRMRVVDAIDVQYRVHESIDPPEMDLAMRDLRERLYHSPRYDAVIRLPLMEAVRTVLADLGLDPHRTFYDLPASEQARFRRHTARPPPDPPP
jgi:hypothetical protein